MERHRLSAALCCLTSKDAPATPLLDLGAVNYMSSAGLRVLMIAAKGCRKQSGKMVLAALQPTIQEIFKIGRFDMVLEAFATVRDALAAISPAALALYDNG